MSTCRFCWSLSDSENVASGGLYGDEAEKETESWQRLDGLATALEPGA